MSFLRILSFVSAVVLLVCATTLYAATGTIRITGSSTMSPLLERAARMFEGSHSGVSIAAAPAPSPVPALPSIAKGPRPSWAWRE